MRRLVIGGIVITFAAGLALSVSIGCNGSKDNENVVMTKRRDSTAPERINTTVEEVTKDEAQQARNQIDKAIQAHGGIENLARLRKYVLTQEGMTEIQGQSVPTVREWQFSFPDQVHLSHTHVGQPSYVIGVNEKGAWARNVQGVYDLPPDESIVARTELYLYWVLSLRPLRNEEFVLKPLPETTVMSKSAKGVRVMQKDHIQIELFFDADTNLLVRAFWRPKEGGRVVEKEIFFSEYKQIEGITLATHWFENRDGEKAMEFTKSDYRFSGKIPDSVFEKPNQ